MIVCLMGPSAAGKSTLAKRLQQSHPHLAATYERGCSELPREPDLSLRAADLVDDNAHRIAEFCGGSAMPFT